VKLAVKKLRVARGTMNHSKSEVFDNEQLRVV